MQQSAEVAQQDVAPVRDKDPLPPEDVAAFLDGNLSGEHLARVESALADSADARAELVEASQMIATMPVARPNARRQRIIAFALTSAAVLAVVVVPSLYQKQRAPQVETERRTPALNSPNFRAIAPAERAAVASTMVRFVWERVPSATYQITLTDVEGQPVWQTTTADTTVVLPATVTLRRPATYYWNVDALAPDGASTTTGVHELRVIER